MSGEPPIYLRRPVGDDAPLPVEIALGLEYGRRPLGDPQQEAEVAAWEARFAALADGLEPVAPPPRVLRAIERAIAPAPPARRAAEPFWRRLGLWRAMTGVSTALATAAVALLLWPDAAPWLAPSGRQVAEAPTVAPPPTPASAAPPSPPVVEAPPPAPAAAPAPVAPPAPRLVAAVAPGPGQAAAFVATYDPEHRQIILVPATRLRDPPPGHTPELWLVPPEGGAPVPLGRVDQTRAHTVDVPERFLPHARTGASLLVTFEPRGAETGRVRGPTFARGRLVAL